MIELRPDVELKDTIVVAMPKLTGEGFYTCVVRVEYEWKPPRCACCKVFGHATRGVPVGSKMGFKPVKQAYKPISTKPTAHTSGNKNNDVKPTIKVSNSNPFDVLNSVENDVVLGTNGGTLNLGELVKKVDYSDDHDSEDEVTSVDNDMARSMASEK
nr:hypothetical protein [Tanacetum cinerariifolium]